MKRIAVISLFAALILAVSVALYAQAGHPPATGPVGSFQVLGARYAVAGIGPAGADVDTNGVFRIDTRTGQTWQYMTGRDSGGKAYDGWAPISEGIVHAK